MPSSLPRLALSVLLIFITTTCVVNAMDATNAEDDIRDACETDEDCLNRGICEVVQHFRMDYHQCSCPSGFGGTTCGKFCPLECQNQGQCHAKIDADNPHGLEPYCVCRGGWGGSLCQYPVTTCDDHFTSCFNGGTCKLLGVGAQEQYGCHCPDGFLGNTCESVEGSRSGSGNANKSGAATFGIVFASFFGLVSGLYGARMLMRNRQLDSYQQDSKDTILDSADGFDPSMGEPHADDEQSVNLEMT